MGDSILLTSNFPAGNNLWNTGSNSNSISIKKPGIYWVDANNYGCSARDSFNVVRNKLPVVKLGNDTAICNGDSIKLNAGNTGSQFLWQDGSTQQTFIAKKSQFFFVSVTDKNNCSKKDSIKITVNSLPFFTLSNDTTICKGDHIQLAANGANINFYQWNPNPSLSSISVFNPVASPINSTQYFISVTDNLGCKNKDSVSINVAELPVIKTINDTAICAGSSIILTTSALEDYSYQWNQANDLSNPFIQNPIASPLATTQYTVTAKNNWGCASKASVSVSIKPLPVLNAFGDTTICSSSDVQLMVTSPGNTMFNWQPNINLNNPAIPNPIGSPLQTTLYKVTVTGNNNCVATDSVLVQVFPKPVFSINPKESEICKGDSLTLSVSGGDQFQWSPAATVLNPASASTQVFPDVDTRYNVLVTDNKCRVSEMVEAVVYIQPKATISITKTNDINCTLGQATLSATGGVRYQWEPIIGLSTPMNSTTVASPEETMMYYVQATSSTGCISKDSIELIVSKVYDEKSYQLPTGFTPNNDGLNDCFGVSKWGYITDLELSIFNRFGERVFFTKDPSNCWDGKYKGSPQDSGTFVYLIKAKGVCGEFTRKGVVVLIR
jgi:gliding motility-associated-like protein